MNLETKSGGYDYDTYEDGCTDNLVREEEHEHFTVFRKYCPGGLFYRVTISNWELKKNSSLRNK